jgi:hypothetical protein
MRQSGVPESGVRCKTARALAQNGPQSCKVKEDILLISLRRSCHRYQGKGYVSTRNE